MRLNDVFRRQEMTMKFLTQLLCLMHRYRTTTAHDDNLRAGKDAPSSHMQPGCWNSLLL